MNLCTVLRKKFIFNWKEIYVRTYYQYIPAPLILRTLKASYPVHDVFFLFSRNFDGMKYQDYDVFLSFCDDPPNSPSYGKILPAKSLNIVLLFVPNYSFYSFLRM